MGDGTRVGGGVGGDGRWEEMGDGRGESGGGRSHSLITLVEEVATMLLALVHLLTMMWVLLRVWWYLWLNQIPVEL